MGQTESFQPNKCLVLLHKVFHMSSAGFLQGKMTLLLGPPGSGKTTLLLTLAGKAASDLKVRGKITYNGVDIHEFVPQRVSAYISQSDVHTGELTVRETFDFATRVQGPGYKAGQ